MKRILMIFSLLICTNLYAAGMCVPDATITSQWYYYAVQPSGSTEPGERGFFEIGTRCNSYVCEKVFARGESHCSVSYIWPVDDWETPGTRCFCRITHVMAPNGFLAPVSNTAWVFNSVWSWTNAEPYISNCVSNCPGYCARNAFFYKVMLTARVEN